MYFLLKLCTLLKKSRGMEDDKKVVIGIDLGGTKAAGGLFRLEGALLTKRVKKLEGRTGEAVGVLIVDLINGLLRSAKEEGLQVTAIGICVPGIYNEIDSTVWAPNIPGWEEFKLKDVVEQGVSAARIPVAIENDRSCSILAEVWKGKAKGCRHALFVTVGTGIGVGIWANGMVLNGAHGIAGSIGWMGMDVALSSTDRQRGNLEQYASGSGISSHAAKLLEESPGVESSLRRIPKKALSAEDVFKAYRENDPIAVSVLETAIAYWGVFTANLISTFNPEKIIFGGGVFGPASQFMDKIISVSEQWAQPISFGKVSIEASTLEGDAGLVGAGYLALKSLKNKV
jgi:glucokinase